MCLRSAPQGVGPEFFAAHSLADLDGRSEYWLGQQGRLTHPVVKRPGDTHDEEISWDGAFALIAAELRALPSPDAAASKPPGAPATRRRSATS